MAHPSSYDVAMTWKSDTMNKTLTIELRSETKNLLIANENETMHVMRVELVPLSNPNFPICELELLWAPVFRDMGAIEAWKYAVLNKKPYLWVTKAQLLQAIE